MIKKAIYTCLMCLSGVSASAQSSIYEHLLQDADSKVMSSAVQSLDYYAYLNQDFMPVMAALPNDNGMLTFIDPVSFGQENFQVWELKFDSKQQLSKSIYADVYTYEFDNETKTWVKGELVTTLKNQDIKSTGTAIRNRLEYLLNNSIIMEKYQPEKKYYKTRGNSFVRIEQTGGSYNIYGPWQHNLNQPVVCESPVDTEKGFYLPVSAPVMPTNMNVAKTLASHSEFSEFFKVLQACGAITLSNNRDNWTACDSQYGNLTNVKDAGDVGTSDQLANTSTRKKATRLLDNFHYTIYVPTNDAMQKAYAAGLPTVAELEKAQEYDWEQEDLGLESCTADRMREVMLDFVKYHIQDHAVFVDNGFKSGAYATAKHQFVESASAGGYVVGAPYKLKVDVSANGITVTDAMGGTHHVISDSAKHNIMANEFWVSGNYTSNSAPSNSIVCNSSFVVLHAIDGPLMYSNDQFEYKERNYVTE